MEDNVVCSKCGAPAKFVEADGVWRHRSPDGFRDASGYCESYGYPIKPHVLQEGEHISPLDVSESGVISLSKTNH